MLRLSSSRSKKGSGGTHRPTRPACAGWQPPPTMLGPGRGPLRARLPLLPLLLLAAAAGPAAAARLPGPGRRAGAEELVARMTLEEKLSLLGGWLADPDNPYPRNYTGQTAGVPRLGIAPIVLNDGPQGFNTGGHLYVRLFPPSRRGGRSEADHPDPRRDRRLSPAGSSTAWPCALAVASTFDVGLARRWGEAMAAEFRGKGADALLGPGVNVLRLPWNGRSFEVSTCMRACMHACGRRAGGSGGLTDY